MNVLPRWFARLFVLALCAAPFGFVGWLVAGSVAALWVAAFVATFAFPFVLAIGR